MNVTKQHLTFISLIAALGLSAAPGLAQRTWVVDAANGPGSDFSTIAAAVTAAAGGDRIQVRSGVYAGAVIDKPLSVFGDAGAEIAVHGSSPGFTITGIQAGQSASLRGFHFLPATGALPLSLSANAGRVALVDLDVESGILLGGIPFVDSASVTLDGCHLRNVLNVTNSKLLATRSTFDYGGFLSPGNIVATQSAVTLVQCQASIPFSTSLSSIISRDSTIELRGTAASSIQGGHRPMRGGTFEPLPAILASGNSTLIADPDVTLAPLPPAGFQTEIQRELSWLTATGGKLGSTVDLELGSVAGETYTLFVGLPGTAIPISNWGDLWLDPNLLLQLTSGTLPASGETSIPRNAPNIPSLIGLALTYQAITGAAPALTNGATVVLHAN